MTYKQKSMIDYMLVNEDRLVDWIESKKGLVITRSKFNEKQYNFSNINSVQYACITGYGIIIKHFFTNFFYGIKPVPLSIPPL